jgi:hypothetical protein
VRTVSGGGIYIRLVAGEAFSYTATFTNGSKTARASGNAARTVGTVKIPTGFGAGSATIALKAESNPARTTSVTLKLGKGGRPPGKHKPKPHK